MARNPCGAHAAPSARAITLLLAAFAPVSTLAQAAAATMTDRVTPYAYKFPYPLPKASAFDYPYGNILGLSFLFYEAQRSGNITNAPDGGNRIAWRGDQLLDDGKDVGLDLSGGHYEAGNRLKVTLASAFTMARLAWSCLYFHDVYANIQFQGESMLYWCKREIKFGAYWLLKTFVPAVKGTRNGRFAPNDQFVIMVGTVGREWGVPPYGDFDCYKRAENIPASPNCVQSIRATLLGNASYPAADAAAETAAALAASAALLQLDYPMFADVAIKTSHALYQFALENPESAVGWDWVVNRTYPTSNVEQHIMFAASMLSWVHGAGCGVAGWPLCNQTLSVGYRANADALWVTPGVQGKLGYPIANWDNCVYDSSLLLDAMTGTVDSAYRKANVLYLTRYIGGEGNGGVSSSAQGMRIVDGQQWGNLRLATFSSYIAGFFVTLPGVDEVFATQARCLARSQMGYVVGDTGYSYVIGYGTKFPRQPSHRDAACTLVEDAAGKCDRKNINDTTYAYVVDRPNPHNVIGGLVGGPDSKDRFQDDRALYEFSEVALDYNVGLTMGLASLASFPEQFWATDCSAYLPNYPWTTARANQPGGRGATTVPTV